MDDNVREHAVLGNFFKDSTISSHRSETRRLGILSMPQAVMAATLPLPPSLLSIDYFDETALSVEDKFGAEIFKKALDMRDRYDIPGFWHRGVPQPNPPATLIATRYMKTTGAVLAPPPSRVVTVIVVASWTKTENAEEVWKSIVLELKTFCDKLISLGSRRLRHVDMAVELLDFAYKPPQYFLTPPDYDYSAVPEVFPLMDDDELASHTARCLRPTCFSGEFGATSPVVFYMELKPSFPQWHWPAVKRLVQNFLNDRGTGIKVFFVLCPNGDEDEAWGDWGLFF